MVLIKKSETFELKASGTCLGVTDGFLTVEDEKTGKKRLDLNLINQFIGKEIKFAVSNKEDVDPKI